MRRIGPGDPNPVDARPPGPIPKVRRVIPAKSFGDSSRPCGKGKKSLPKRRRRIRPGRPRNPNRSPLRHHHHLLLRHPQRRNPLGSAPSRTNNEPPPGHSARAKHLRLIGEPVAQRLLPVPPQVSCGIRNRSATPLCFAKSSARRWRFENGMNPGIDPENTPGWEQL